jgi:hypothetical protein
MFQIALKGCKSVSKIRNGPPDSDLSDNRSLDTCQACLLGTHEHDQVEPWQKNQQGNVRGLPWHGRGHRLDPVRAH